MSGNVNLELEYIRKAQTIRDIENEFVLNIFENRFFKNLEYLIDNSEKVKFQSTWNLNPQQFCLDHYNIFEIYPIILLVNNINSIFEFKNENIKNNIISPSINSIYNLLIQ